MIATIELVHRTQIGAERIRAGAAVQHTVGDQYGIVFLSSSDTWRDRTLQVLDAGWGFLTKPVRLPALRALIAQLMVIGDDDRR